MWEDSVVAFQGNGASTAILVVDTKALGRGALFRIDPVSGQQTAVSSGDLFDAPIGIAIAEDGTVLVTDLGPEGPDSGCVLRVDSATGAQERVSSGGMLRRPFGVAVEHRGTVLVADAFAFLGGGVIRVDPATGAQTEVFRSTSTGGGLPLRPVGIALEADGAILLVLNNLAGGGAGEVVRVDPTDGRGTVVSTGGEFSKLTGVAVESDGGILVTNVTAVGGGVIRVDPATGEQVTVSSEFSSPVDIAVEAGGGILLTDSAPGNATLIRVDPVTGAQTQVSSGGVMLRPHGIALQVSAAV